MSNDITSQNCGLKHTHTHTFRSDVVMRNVFLHLKMQSGSGSTWWHHYSSLPRNRHASFSGECLAFSMSLTLPFLLLSIPRSPFLYPSPFFFCLSVSVSLAHPPIHLHPYARHWRHLEFFPSIWAGPDMFSSLALTHVHTYPCANGVCVYVRAVCISV